MLKIKTLKVLPVKSRYIFDEVSGIPQFKLFAGGSNMKNGDVIDFHDHDFWELVIVHNGLGWHLCEEKKFHISTGNVFMIPLGLRHGYKSVDNLSIYNILFYPEILKTLNNDLRSIPGFQMLFHIEPKMSAERRMRGNLRIDENILPEIVKHINNMFSEQKSQHPGFQTALTAAFLEIVLLISRNCHTADDKYYHHASRISKVISYMEAHYKDALTLESLAKLSGLSLGTFRRRFQEAANMAPITYLLKLRLNKAALILTSTDLPITEIAFQCGFSDSNYFSHQFRKFFGTAPSVHRNRRSGKLPGIL